MANSQLTIQESKDLNGIEVIAVETAAQMHAALEKEFPATNLLVMSAAVADARPSQISGEKIKKGQLKDIVLIENPDLLKSIAKMRDKQIIIAFAAETNSDQFWIEKLRELSRHPPIDHSIDVTRVLPEQSAGPIPNLTLP